MTRKNVDMQNTDYKHTPSTMKTDTTTRQRNEFETSQHNIGDVLNEKDFDI